MDQHDKHMGLALDLAREAEQAGEVPVGAVVVHDGRVVGRGHNGPIHRSDPTAHAEILALRDASARLDNYRLTGATLYTTVEPCLMCLGAMLHARIGCVVYGASDPKLGATARLDELMADGGELNHRLETIGGVRGDESSRLLVEFFRSRRGAATASRESVAVPEKTVDGEVPKWS